MSPNDEIVYLDHNATTPLHPEVLKAMLPHLQELSGNPSSIHSAGIQARNGVEAARASLARALHCNADEIHFTSGGTESDNWAIKGLCRGAPDGGKVVTSAVEHPAVLRSCQYLEKLGHEVVYVPVDAQGIVDLGALDASLDENTALLSIMHGNNETGSLQPVHEASLMARQRGIPFHVDAVQTFGKLPVNLAELNADAVSVSAHKINGPKGVGALFVRAGTAIEALMHGGDRQGAGRAGTENVASIIGFGRAAELCQEHMAEEAERCRHLRDRLETGLLAAINDIVINGGVGQRLTNTSNIAFTAVESEAVVMGLDLAGIAVSSGSACASGSADPSHVLLAMGRSPREAACAVRFSIGRSNNETEIDRVIDVVPTLVSRLRELSVFT